MPDERVGDPGNPGSAIADLAEAAGPGSVDGRHLLLVGAGPGLGMAVARRFAVGGYRVTLVARSRDGLGGLAGTLADTGAKISTIAADASDPDRLGARMRELYLGNGAPGVIVYNAVMGAPDRLLSSRVAHLRVAPQQHQTHLGLVNLDLEPKHLTQERGGGCKIVNLQIGAAARELDHRLMLRAPRSPISARRRSALTSGPRGI